MENLKTQIETNLKISLKEKDIVKTRTYRSVLTKIIEEGKKAGKTPDDNLILSLIEKLGKQRIESINAFEKVGRTDLVLIEKQELEVLNQFIPQKYTEKETLNILKSIIANGSCNIGIIMKELSKYGNLIDKKLASDLLKTLL